MAGVRVLSCIVLVSAVLLCASAPLRAAAVDAQEACVAPVQSFVAALDGGETGEPQRRDFLGLVEACTAVYLHELGQIERDYSRLPATSHCRDMGEEFRDTLETLRRIERTASTLPLDSTADREAAAAFYRLAAPGLARAVNGLFILHHGICREEVRGTLRPVQSSNATISAPDEAPGRL